MSQEIMDILRDALDEVNAMREHPLTFSPALHLIGRQGCFDSVELVSFVATVEDLLAEKMGQELHLVSEKAFSRGKSPFFTMETLSAYVEELRVPKP